jgi:hypothetical protein
MEHLEPEDYLWYTRPGGGRIQRSTPIGKGSFAVGGAVASPRPAFGIETPTLRGTPSQRGGSVAAVASKR